MNRITLLILMGVLCHNLTATTLYPTNNQPVTSLHLQQGTTSNQILFLYKIDPNYQFLEVNLISKEEQTTRKIPLPNHFKSSVLSFYESLQEFSIVQKSKRQQFIQTSHQFYQLLLKPFQQQFQQKEQLVVIGQGILQYLPFEILLAESQDKPFEQLDFLVKHHAVSYFFSPENFLQSQGNTSKRLLGFAPVFQKKNIQLTHNSSSNRAIFSPPNNFFDHIPALPYSEQEVKAIPEIFPISASLLLHQQAQKATLQNSLQQDFQYIHLATHSFADFEDNQQAGILCAGGPNECDPAYEILYTTDIEKLTINADLVVLSSCQSGVGQLNSDGVQGIHRSFYKAGAKNVVFSLWKVNDRICQQFMAVFYTEIAKGNSYAHALRAAKLDLLQSPNTASPNVWGAFLMIGK